MSGEQFRDNTELRERIAEIRTTHVKPTQTDRRMHLTKRQLKILNDAIESRGTATVAKELGIARETLRGILIGSSVRNGTIALAKAYVSKVKA